MNRQHLEMIYSSPYIENEFKEKTPSVNDLPHNRILEYIMTGGIRPESEKDFVAFASYVIGVKHIDLSRHKTDETLAEVIPFKIAYAYKVAPLHLEEGVLEVACLDPAVSVRQIRYG